MQEKLISDIKILLKDHNYLLYDFEINNQNQNLNISLFVDTNLGIGIDLLQSEIIVKKIKKLLEKKKIADYDLDVSSPGIIRKLRTKEHYQLQIQQKIKVKTATSTVIGKVNEVNDDAIIIEDQKILYKEIIHAETVYEFKGEK